MQAQGMKRYVADHVVESILTAAAVGVALGVAIALALGGLLGGAGSPAITTTGSDAGAALVGGTGFGIGGSQGVLTQSGELAGPGEGLNAGFVFETGAAAAPPSVAQAGLERIVGPGEGVMETVVAGPAQVERLVGPGEGIMEPAYGASTLSTAGETGVGIGGSRGFVHDSGVAAGPGEGLNPAYIAEHAATVPDVGPRIIGPGEGLMNPVHGAASGTPKPITGPGEGLMGSGS
jgi:hypothetical protein